MHLVESVFDETEVITFFKTLFALSIAVEGLRTSQHVARFSGISFPHRHASCRRKFRLSSVFAIGRI
jgi:hypothetical protein